MTASDSDQTRGGSCWWPFAGGLVLLYVACGDDPTAVPAPTATATTPQVAPAQPTASPTESADECSGSDGCTRWGRSGTCLGGRCIVRGFCAYDQDCNDGNDCTTEACNRGVCTLELKGGPCTLGGSATGVCAGDACLPAPPARCTADVDCADSAGPCWAGTCVEGHCQLTGGPDEAECELASGLPGVCRVGSCVTAAPSEERVVTCRTINSRFGPYQDCSARGPRYQISAEGMVREATRIEDKIRDGVLYEVLVSLVPLSDGGYNILVFNRRPRDEVQGLVDPSFVAFEVGGYTSNSAWKSRELQIWLTPYAEGWQISTSGGRRALRRGRAASGLGFLGVVNIKAFRTWLQRAFRPMAAPAARTEDVVMLR